MNKCLLPVLIFLCTLTYGSEFGTISYKKAIYISSRQSLLSLKITKTLLTAQNDNNLLSSQLLKPLISEFETNHFTLKNNANNTSTKVKLGLRNVQKHLSNFKLITSQNSDLEIFNLGQGFHNACEVLTKNIFISAEQLGDITNDLPSEMKQLRTILKASKQATLAEHLVCLFLACQAEIDTPNSCYKIEKIRAQQKSDLEYFIFNCLNTDSIETHLNQITVEYQSLDYYVAHNFNKKLSTQKILEFTTEISDLYSIISLEYIDSYKLIPDLNTDNFKEISSMKDKY